MYILLNAQKKNDESEGQKLLFQQIESVREAMEKKQEKLDEKIAKNMHDQTEVLQKQFHQSSRIIAEVTEKLTKLDSTNKQVVGFAEQMKSLENILKNPKQRGILGEYFLETLLGNVLPPDQYKMQYKIDEGKIVDAAVMMRDQVIPIDAKFSLEKYNQLMETEDKERREALDKEFRMDVKNRIDETSKYIMPDKGTTDFALMFIPAEGIYYNLLIYKVGATGVNAKDLVEYAFEKKVMIVSPTSFFAYLQTILQGLKELKVEEQTKEIIKRVGELGRHMKAYDEHFAKLGKHLGTTVSMYNSAYKELAKMDRDVLRISGENAGIETDELGKPQIEN